MTFWQAYWKLTAGVLRGVSIFGGIAVYGYVAGSFVPTKPWLTVLMLLTGAAFALALGARQMLRDK